MANTQNTPKEGQILIDTSALNIIKGRIEPHIYAFRIDSFPPSYKIGDTFRDVDIRISEWRKIYSGLSLTHEAEWEWSAMINDSFFRDHAVHKYLEEEKGRKAMEQEAFGPYHYSSEFYRDTEIKEIEDAISFLRTNAVQPDSAYKLYSASSLGEVDKGFKRDQNMKLRDNQKEVVDNFITAYKKGRKNLLMYAVMRFGKTFTALCCAQRINAKTILVVSAKADVASEWQKNVQSIVELKNYNFFSAKNLKKLEFEKELSEGNTVVLFLTLQDLKGARIKSKHKKVFNQCWDIVIVDESHFGARAAQYGMPLLDAQKQDAAEDKVDKKLSAEVLDEELKHLKRKVTLHLSGTPYRILMSNEFKDDDLIACVRYPDIIEARDKWFESHVDSKNEDLSKSEEWENPYFGFPQMIRFAFNLNEESLRLIQQMVDEGASIKFSDLLRPLSTRKKGKSTAYRKFQHEREVLSLLQAIDGTKDDENVLGFLDNERIKQGKLCNHIVMVLPFRASCDAMVSLIENNQDKFKNLNDYKVINIAGLDCRSSVNDIARKIHDCESKGIKTLSLTVRRMLTGVTVPEWDTMIYLKETYSPEEYDQAVYRIQNQHTKIYKNPDGSFVKYDMKPQTILVDFDPQRMFKLQERKCSIYNSTPQLRGQKDIKDFVEEELAFSPIIFLDHHKLRQIDASDLMDEIRKYAQTRGIPEEAETIPIDFNLLENQDILRAIAHLNTIDSKAGICKEANSKKSKGDDGKPTKGDGSADDSHTPLPKTEKEKDSTLKRLATYYSLILYFAFLTPDRVLSIKDIIKKLDNPENRRIAKNIGLEKRILEIIASSQPWTLLGLNKSIADTNHTAHMAGLSREEMINVVLKRCNRLSEAEIVTPAKIADEMVALLPDDLFEGDGIVLDIASKQGEFAVALSKRYGKKYPEECKNRIYSLCTSGLAYEFTRKTYQYLGCNIDNIITNIRSKDIIADKLKNKIKGKYLTIKEIIGKDMKIRAIVGNPPYHVNDGSGASDDASNPIYQEFVNISKTFIPQFISMIMPSKWMVGGKVVLKSFRSAMMNEAHISHMVDYENDREIFPIAHNDGGICHFLYNNNYNKKGSLRYIYHLTNGQILDTVRTLKDGKADIVIRDARRISIIDKVSQGEKRFKDIVSLTQPYGIRKDLFNSPERYPDAHLSETPFEGCVKIYGVKGIKGGAKRTEGYITTTPITKNSDTVEKYKLFFTTSYSTNATTPPQAIIGNKNEICTETFLMIGPFATQTEQLNCKKFFDTNFFKILLFFGRGTMQVSRDVFRFIPLLDFSDKSKMNWNKSMEEIDAHLYAKYNFSDEEIAFIESMIKPM